MNSMPWNTIIGQRRVKTLLQALLRGGRIPHALLFTGPEGVGKDAVALMTARTLRCGNPQDGGGSPCNACRGCVTTAALQNPNVRFVFALPAGKGEDSRSDSPLIKLADSELTVVQEQMALKATDPYHNIAIPRAQQIKISSIREIRRDNTLASAEPGWRIVIISEAHLMGEGAANAFLKTLEEPNAHMVLILTSSHREKLLPTILSRCQEVRFDSLNEEEIAEALRRERGVDRTTAALTAKLAEGSFSRAVELTGGDLNGLRFDVVALLRAALRRSPLALHGEIERLTAKGDRYAAERILMLLSQWLRDALTMRIVGSDRFVVNTDQVRDIQSFNTKFVGAPVDKMITEVDRSIRAVRSNAQIPLVFTVLGLNLEALAYAGGTTP